ncbi:MAG: DCC1-like thiol-disulfide oxidoreductase family protein [Bacteroidota bacterium]|nr:DCC1-like thiol-disulfide oxidoreductase family protein [Bacteroidota bacterium]
MAQSPVIIFDGVCNLCCGWVQFLMRKDKRMKFKLVAIQSNRGQHLLQSVGLHNRDLETVIYLKGSQYFRESSAVLEILEDLGGMWKAVRLLRLIPRSVRDAIYRYFAKRRYRLFGKRSTCLLPTPENQKRFLL